MLYRFLKQVNLEEELFPIFFNESWLNSQESVNSKSFIYVDSELKSVISFTQKKIKLLLKAEYNFVPVDFEGRTLDEPEERICIEKFHHFLKVNSMCDVILPPQHFVSFKSVPSKSIYFNFGIFKVELASTEAEYLSKLSSENRRQIRRAKDSEVYIEFGNHLLDDFYQTYLETNKSKAISSLGLDFFLDLIEHHPSNCLIGVCYFQGVPQAGVFDLIDTQNAYSLYSGTKSDLTVKGAKKLLINEEFNFLRSKNISTYLFGGYRANLTKTDSLYHVQEFKKSMGADVTYGIHFIKVFNPFKYYIFNSLLSIKSRLTKKKLGLINLEGVDIKKSR